MKRNTAKTFFDLQVWQKSHEFVLAIYEYTKGFPKHEMYGLSSQMRRAAVSTAANVAEGFKKRSVRDKLRFLSIAQSSLEESRYYLVLAQDLGYGRTPELTKTLEDASRLLHGYMRAISDPDSSCS
jgi:four helix bundle protein